MSNKMDRPFLVGEKIYLRPFDLDDIDGDYFQWVNDSEIIRLLDSNAFPKTKAEIVDYVTNTLNNKDYLFFAVIEKSSGKHIGNVKIGPINWIDRRNGYGRMMSRASWGKGYGTEIVQLIIRHIFDVLNLNRIIDYATSSNIASIKSNEKAGMDVEGEIEEYDYRDGEYQNVTIIGLTRKRYLAKKREGLI